MTLLAGTRSVDGVHAWQRVEDGITVELGEGAAPEEPDASGWLVPAPVNAHTHVGDAFLRDRPGKPDTVAELFGPGGWKHQQLARAAQEQQADGMRRYAQEMAACGTAAFLDFREQGVAGLKAVRSLQLPVRPILYGRGAAAGFDPEEAAQVCALADGIGLSGLRDLARPDLEAWADAARAAGKPLAIHVSEDARDDVASAIALQPAFVVHMTLGTKADFRALAEADVPVVVCPRSNRFFGRRPPVEDMLQAGCTVALGTDNGLLQNGDLWAEARATGLPEPQALSLATNGRRLAGLDDGSWAKGAPAWTVAPKSTRRHDDVVVP